MMRLSSPLRSFVQADVKAKGAAAFYKHAAKPSDQCGWFLHESCRRAFLAHFSWLI
jgi:hypothetical protein